MYAKYKLYKILQQERNVKKRILIPSIIIVDSSIYLREKGTNICIDYKRINRIKQSFDTIDSTDRLIKKSDIEQS